MADWQRKVRRSSGEMEIGGGGGGGGKRESICQRHVTGIFKIWNFASKSSLTCTITSDFAWNRVSVHRHPAVPFIKEKKKEKEKKEAETSTKNHFEKFAD